MNQFQKNIALVLTVLLVFLLVWQLYNQPKTGTKEIIYSEMLTLLTRERSAKSPFRAIISTEN